MKNIKIKKQLDKKLKENDCIFATSEGTTIIYGEIDKVVSSIGFALANLEKESKVLYDSIMEELELARKHFEKRGEK